MGKGKKGKPSDGPQGGSGGSGGPPPQKPSQGGPGGSGGPPPQRPQQGGPPPQRPAQGGPGGSGGPTPQQPQQGGPGGHPSQRPAQGGPRGPGGPGGPGGPRGPGGPKGPPSQRPAQGGPGGSGGPPPQRPQQGGPPPQGAPPSQAWKGGSGQQPGGAFQKPSSQSGMGPQGGPSGQGQQGGPKGPKKGPQGGQAQGPPAQKPAAATSQPPTAAMASMNISSNQPPPSRPVGKSPSQSVMAIPLRNKPGTLGRRTVVEVNQLPLNFDDLVPKIYHYDLNIEPDKPRRLLRPAVEKFAQRNFPTCKTAFDGRKNLYAAKKLPVGTVKPETGKVTVINDERQSNNELEFTITIKLAQEINMGDIRRFLKGELRDVPQSAIQAIDVVLRSAPLQGVSVPVGRSYFIPPGQREQIVDLGGGLHLWYGFYQSAILNWKPFLNVDVAHKGFPKPVLLTELLQDVCNLRDLSQAPNDMLLRKFKGFVTTLKIDYEIPRVSNTRRTYRINNTGKSPDQLRFRPDNGPEITVADYFRTAKGYRLQYPHLPTVQVDPVAKNIFLPLELCTLKSGQALNRKLDESQTACMVRAAAQPPHVRKNRILDAIKNARYNSSPVVREFGIRVTETMEKVEARVLDAPGVEYKNVSNPRPQPGAWRAGKFLLSNALSTWCIMNLDFQTRDDACYRFSDMLQRQGNDLGMTINKVSEVRKFDTRNNRVQADIMNWLSDKKKQQVELVVVVIPKFGDFYSMVKRIAELQVGILTQCIKSQTMFKMNPATCGNILLKVNSKTNGVNHQLGRDYKPKVLLRPVMFVGIDVTHPSPDQTSIPSVAAVSASHDAKAFQYNMIWRLQQPREEIVVDLKNIMVEQLHFFHKKTGYKPEKIIVYRDGVSEGQFQQVMNAELTAIRNACLEIEKGSNYKPGITFLVVQKRHHVRFFPTKREDEDGKNRNVPPGTIVDTVITHPRELDFYLVSHASLQGTSRPTKYHRLWDDNNISEDELEILTYYLCYLFSRCTRSVSYPAPTYYAHLAAFRARTYLENNPARLNDLKGFADRNKIEPTFAKNSPMFFV